MQLSRCLRAARHAGTINNQNEAWQIHVTSRLSLVDSRCSGASPLWSCALAKLLNIMARATLSTKRRAVRSIPPSCACSRVMSRAKSWGGNLVGGGRPAIPTQQAMRKLPRRLDCPFVESEAQLLVVSPAAFERSCTAQSPWIIRFTRANTCEKPAKSGFCNSKH